MVNKKEFLVDKYFTTLCIYIELSALETLDEDVKDNSFIAGKDKEFVMENFDIYRQGILAAASEFSSLLSNSDNKLNLEKLKEIEEIVETALGGDSKPEKED